MNPNNEQTLKLMAYNNLLAYAKLRYKGFMINWHHVEIAAHLMALERGDITRLIIEAPPRHGKSFLVSEFFPAWYMGRNPTHEFIFGTYAQSLANTMGRKVRNTLESDKIHLELFPDSQVTNDSHARDEFSTIAGGAYHGKGVDGALTGKGGHTVLLDDTIKGWKQARSEAFRREVIDWYQGTIYTRLPPDGKICLMQTRWHEEDLIGYVLSEQKHDGWVRLTYPAIDEIKNTALWPERFNYQRLLKIKKTLAPAKWESLYMQRPSASEGELFKERDLVYYKELPKKFDLIIQSWDFAFKDTAASDFVVGQVWGKVGPDAYLIDQFRDRCDFPASVNAILKMTNRHPKARLILIEDKANGSGIIQVLKNKVSGIRPVNPQGSKPERASRVLFAFQGHNIHIPDPSLKPWVKEYVYELKMFPNGKFDDQVDSTTQALDHLFTSSVEKYRMFLE